MLKGMLEEPSFQRLVGSGSDEFFWGDAIRDSNDREFIFTALKTLPCFAIGIQNNPILTNIIDGQKQSESQSHKYPNFEP